MQVDCQSPSIIMHRFTYIYLTYPQLSQNQSSIIKMIKNLARFATLGFLIVILIVLDIFETITKSISRIKRFATLGCLAINHQSINQSSYTDTQIYIQRIRNYRQFNHQNLARFAKNLNDKKPCQVFHSWLPGDVPKGSTSTEAST